MEAHPFHLYVVEDDASLRQMLAEYLRGQGLAVTAMATAEEMLQRLHRRRPDLAVVDVVLPGLSGLDACRQLREQGDRLPLILLTGRTDEVDRVLGLELGADDYVGKPFSARELLARVRAVLRRAAQPPGSPRGGDAAVQLGACRFEPSTRLLRSEDGDRVLTAVEYALLAELVANPRVAISRERLLAVSHPRDRVLEARTVDVAVMRLRKLFEPDPAMPRYIQTVRGAGYMFVPHPAPG